jgi:HK97 gp10 family phage protein
MAVNWKAIERAGIVAAIEVMNRSAVMVAQRARKLAPVRKVFQGQDDNYRTRLKKLSEIRNDRAIRKALNLGPENPYINPPSIVTQRAPQRLGRQRAIAAPGRLVMQSSMQSLTRRGRYELRTMRAAHKDMLGGRLRDEIHATQARMVGRRIVVQVVSPTPYAKYQEYGTNHNPAHPYLRPAAHEHRHIIRKDVLLAVAAGAKPYFRGRYEVEARFRVRGAVA